MDYYKTVIILSVLGILVGLVLLYTFLPAKYGNRLYRILELISRSLPFSALNRYFESKKQLNN